MARHSKSRNITMTTTAQRKAWAEGPTCQKCRRLQIGTRGGLSCPEGHEIGSAASCPDFWDATRQSPGLPAGNGR